MPINKDMIKTFDDLMNDNNIISSKSQNAPEVFDSTKSIPILKLTEDTLDTELQGYENSIRELDKHTNRLIFGSGVAIPTLISLVTVSFQSQLWFAFFIFVFCGSLGLCIYAIIYLMWLAEKPISRKEIIRRIKDKSNKVI